MADDLLDKLRAPSDEVNRRGRAKYGGAWQDDARSPDSIDFAKLYPSNPLHGALMMGGPLMTLREGYEKRVEIERGLQDDLFAGRARAIVVRNDGTQFEPPHAWWFSDQAIDAIKTGQHSDGRLWIAPQGYELPAAAESAAADGLRRRASGRNDKYDWVDFDAEVVRRIHDDGVPISDREFSDQMLEWCQGNWKTEPGESTVRKRIAKLLAPLRKSGGS